MSRPEERIPAEEQEIPAAAGQEGEVQFKDDESANGRDNPFQAAAEGVAGRLGVQPNLFLDAARGIADRLGGGAAGFVGPPSSLAPPPAPGQELDESEPRTRREPSPSLFRQAMSAIGQLVERTRIPEPPEPGTDEFAAAQARQQAFGLQLESGFLGGVPPDPAKVADTERLLENPFTQVAADRERETFGLEDVDIEVGDLLGRRSFRADVGVRSEIISEVFKREIQQRKEQRLLAIRAEQGDDRAAVARQGLGEFVAKGVGQLAFGIAEAPLAVARFGTEAIDLGLEVVGVDGETTTFLEDLVRDVDDALGEPVGAQKAGRPIGALAGTVLLFGAAGAVTRRLALKAAARVSGRTAAVLETIGTATGLGRFGENAISGSLVDATLALGSDPDSPISFSNVDELEKLLRDDDIRAAIEKFGTDTGAKLARAGLPAAIAGRDLLEGLDDIVAFTQQSGENKAAVEVLIGLGALTIFEGGIRGIGRVRRGRARRRGQIKRGLKEIETRRKAAQADPDAVELPGFERDFEELAARREVEARTLSPELARKADEDPLTGAVNKRVDEELTQAALRTRAPGTRLVRFRVDLDNFKAVNDAFGHDLGDRALKATARALAEFTREGDHVARLGGDEFAVTLTISRDADPEQIARRLEDRVATRLREVGVPETIGNSRTGASIGFAEAVEGTRRPQDLDVAADGAASLRKKEKGVPDRASQQLTERDPGAGDRVKPGTDPPDPDIGTAENPGIRGEQEPLVIPEGFGDRGEQVSKKVFGLDRGLIDIEADRFQFKIEGIGAGGVSRKLAAVKVWKPNQAGTVGVWWDAADRRWKVVNGHHRLALYDKLKPTDKAGDPLILNVMEVLAADDNHARAMGAMINISEGRGTAFDAATYLRGMKYKAQDLINQGIPLTETVVQEGLALSNLEPGLFEAFRRKELGIERAVLIGESNLSPAQQDGLLGLIRREEGRGKKINNEKLEELIRFTSGAGETVSKDVQVGMFGDLEVTRSNVLHKSDVSVFVKKRLASDKRLFQFLSKQKRAEQIAAEGVGTIKAERAERLGEENAKFEEFYTLLSTRTGPVSDILGNAAERLARGENGKKVKRDALEQIREELARIIERGEEGGPAGGGAPLPGGARPAGESGPALGLPGRPPEDELGGIGTVLPGLEETPTISFGELLTAQDVRTSAKVIAESINQISDINARLEIATEIETIARLRMEETFGNVAEGTTALRTRLGHPDPGVDVIVKAAIPILERMDPVDAFDDASLVLNSLRGEAGGGSLARLELPTAPRPVRDDLLERLTELERKPQLGGDDLEEMRRIRKDLESDRLRDDLVNDIRDGGDDGPSLFDGPGVNEPLGAYRARIVGAEEDRAIKAFGSVKEANEAADDIIQGELFANSELGKHIEVVGDGIKAGMGPVPGLSSVAERQAFVTGHRQRRAWMNIRGMDVTSPEVAAELIRFTRDPRHEFFSVLFLDDAGRVLGHNLTSAGAVNYSIVGMSTPRPFEFEPIRRQMARLGSNRIIIGHNHPSGRAAASRDDINLTAQLAANMQRFGIRVDGHVIINDNTFSWFGPDDLFKHKGRQTPEQLDEFLASLPERQATRKLDDALLGVFVRTMEKRVPDPNDWTAAIGKTRFGAPEQVASLVQKAKGGGTAGRVDILYLTAQNKVLAAEPMSMSTFARLKNWLPQRSRAMGALRVMVVTSERDYEAVLGLASDFQRTNFTENGRILDVVGIRPLGAKQVFPLSAQAGDGGSFLPPARQLLKPPRGEQRVLEQTGHYSPEESLSPKRILAHFGETANPFEAGYVMPGGEMADFSGRHSAGGSRSISSRSGFDPRDEFAGARFVDHRDVIELIPDDIEVGGFDAMNQVIGAGSIRMTLTESSLLVTIVERPTSKQVETLGFAIDFAQGKRPSEDFALYVDVVDRDGTHLVSNELVGARARDVRRTLGGAVAKAESARSGLPRPVSTGIERFKAIYGDVFQHADEDGFQFTIIKGTDEQRLTDTATGFVSDAFGRFAAYDAETQGLGSGFFDTPEQAIADFRRRAKDQGRILEDPGQYDAFDAKGRANTLIGRRINPPGGELEVTAVLASDGLVELRHTGTGDRVTMSLAEFDSFPSFPASRFVVNKSLKWKGSKQVEVHQVLDTKTGEIHLENESAKVADAYAARNNQRNAELGPEPTRTIDAFGVRRDEETGAWHLADTQTGDLLGQGFNPGDTQPPVALTNMAARLNSEATARGDLAELRLIRETGPGFKVPQERFLGRTFPLEDGTPAEIIAFRTGGVDPQNQTVTLQYRDPSSGQRQNITPDAFMRAVGDLPELRNPAVRITPTGEVIEAATLADADRIARDRLIDLGLEAEEVLKFGNVDVEGRFVPELEIIENNRAPAIDPAPTVADDFRQIQRSSQAEVQQEMFGGVSPATGGEQFEVLASSGEKLQGLKQASRQARQTIARLNKKVQMNVATPEEFGEFLEASKLLDRNERIGRRELELEAFKRGEKMPKDPGREPGLFDELGAVPGHIPVVLASTGIGAALGAYAADPEERLISALVGAAAGAGGGFLLARVTAKLLRPRLSDELLARALAKGDDLHGERAPRLDPPLGGEVDVDEFFNVGKFLEGAASEPAPRRPGDPFPTDMPALERELRREMEEVLRTWPDGIPKEIITWEETRALAESMGFDVADILRQNWARVTGPEALTLRNVTVRNVQTILLAQKRLYSDVALTTGERAGLTKMIGQLESWNDRLLEQFTRARSSAGRNLNTYKMMAQQTDDPFQWYTQVKRQLGDRPFTDEHRAAIDNLLEEAAETGDRTALLEFVASVRVAGFSEKFIAFWKAGLLTGPPTHMANILGNTSMFVIENAKDPAALVFDRLLSLLTNVETKAPTLRGFLRGSRRGLAQGAREAQRATGITAFRETFSREGASLMGVKKALVNMVQQIRDPTIFQESLRKVDQLRNVNFNNVFLDVWTKIPFKALVALDRVFRAPALLRSLEEQARLLARREGFKAGSREFDQRVLALLELPTDEMALQAIADSELAIFTNKGLLGETALNLKASLRRAGSVSNVAGEMTLPFTLTPANIATRVVELTPFGVLKTAPDLARLFRLVQRGAEPEVIAPIQRRIADVLGRSSIGFGAVTLGYLLQRQDLMTGAFPVGNRTEQRKWQREGRIENAVLFNGKWRSLERVSPIGNVIIFGAHLSQLAAVQDATVAGFTVGAAASIAKTTTEQTFLRGVAGTLKAINEPQREGEGFAEGVARSIVPRSVGRLAVAIDPTVREVHGVKDAIRSQLPFASRTLIEKVNDFGETIVRERGLVAAMLDPFNSRTDVREDDPIVAEMARIDAGLPDIKRGRGESDEDFKERQILFGQATRQLLESLIDSEAYKQAGALAARRLKGADVEAEAIDLQRSIMEDAITDLRRELPKRIQRIRTSDPDRFAENVARQRDRIVNDIVISTRGNLIENLNDRRNELRRQRSEVKR